MCLSFKLRDALPLMAAILLIAATFLLPPYEAYEPPAVEAFSEDGCTLIIDAGHGGADGGAVAADGSVESEINLSIARRLDMLAGLVGINTVMTRESESIEYPENAATVREMKRADQKARIELINSVPSGVLISIHQNFYPDPGPSGSQVLYASTQGSRELGEATHGLLVSSLCPDNRRVAAPVDESIYLMRSVRCPAILVECGFISNANELAKLKSGEYQSKLAAVLLSAYTEFASAKDGMSV